MATVLKNRAEGGLSRLNNVESNQGSRRKRQVSPPLVRKVDTVQEKKERSRERVKKKKVSDWDKQKNLKELTNPVIGS